MDLRETSDRRKEELPVPEALKAAIRDIADDLRRAAEGQAADDFDDALQTEGLVGGRYLDEPRPYRLTYFHDSAGPRGQWQLRLARIQIMDLADGHIRSLVLFGCTKCGHRSTEEAFTCACPNHPTAPLYPTFPIRDARDVLDSIGLTTVVEGTTREELDELLGKPECAREATALSAVATYTVSDQTAVFEFWKSGRIRNLTLRPKSDSPGTAAQQHNED